MRIGERIKQIRKENGLTLDKFGDKIKISGPSVSRLEKGINNPSEQTVALICQQFHVQEEWLRNGTGEMMSPETPQDDADMIKRVAEKYGLNDTDREILTIYLEVGAEGRALIRRHIAKLIRDVLDNPLPDEVPLTDEEIAAKTAAYNQLLKGAKAAEDSLRVNTQMPKPTSSGFFGNGKAV